jgi:putative DNA primase/helicase
MTFDRARLPDPQRYYEEQGLRLTGNGTWKTAPCIFHGGSDSLGVNIETGGYTCRNPSCDAKGGNVLDYHMAAHSLGFVEAAADLSAWLVDASDQPHTESQRAIRPAKAVSRPVAKSEQEPLPEYGLALWNAAVALRGTVGERYLQQARGCAPSHPYGDLRYHPCVRHSPTGTSWPALIGGITDAITGELIGVHRTYLAPDGSRKAPIEPARMNLGRKQGGVIRLWPDECVTYGLGVAEGIETALTLATALKPVWSAIDAGNLAAFPVLPGIEVLTIAADHDEAGLAAANACALRWTEAGCDVRLVIPPRERTDLNDYARESA